MAILSLTIMGIHQCPLIIRSCKWLNISSFIRTLHDVLRYLGTHWHQWRDCLALLNEIHQWSVIQWLISMFDINIFIRMVRIVPSGFAAGGYYIIFMASLTVLQQHTSNHMSTTVSLSALIFYFIQPSTSSDPSLHILLSSSSHIPIAWFINFLGKWRYVVF